MGARSHRTHSRTGPRSSAHRTNLLLRSQPTSAYRAAPRHPPRLVSRHDARRGSL